MSAVLHIYDGSFEDGDLYVVADQLHELGVVAADYLRAAAPVEIGTGSRVVVPTEEPAGGWIRWIREVQMDLDFLDFEFFDSADREVFSPADMATWISFHAAELHRQHTPYIETIKTDLL